jgi:hypothetical protein
MPILRAFLQNDRILHTKCHGILTDDDLLGFYRDLFAEQLQHKYLLELIDGSRVTEFAITENSQVRLKEFVGRFFQILSADIAALAEGGGDLPEITARYDRALTNSFCNPMVAHILGLPKNQRISHPPTDRPTLHKILQFLLEAQINRKTAMFATQEQILDVFRRWEKARRDLGYTIGVFADLSEASAWLLIP